MEELWNEDVGVLQRKDGDDPEVEHTGGPGQFRSPSEASMRRVHALRNCKTSARRRLQERRRIETEWKGHREDGSEQRSALTEQQKDRTKSDPEEGEERRRD